MSSATATDPGAPPSRAILLLALASFVGAANLRVCDALLPQIAAELRITIGSAASMVTAFAVAYGVCQIIVGPLGDARGKLLLVVLGSLWAGVATLLCALMPSLAPLVLFRFLGGAGAAAVIPLAIAWIGDVVPYERRQALLARYISGQILGIVFGQAAGGLFGELIGWRATLLLLGILHIGAGLLLLNEQRRLGAGLTSPRQPRWIEAARAAYRLVRLPWVRVVLISVFIEGMAMFGALAYVGADLHARFGLGLGMVGAFLPRLARAPCCSR
jgi:predicted MFS family arabinose efflux permease